MVGSKGNENSSSKPKSIPFKICLCKYCGRRFYNAQALGGHQNAHRKERQEAKDHRSEVMTSVMISSFGMALMPSSFVQPHGLAQHQSTGGQPAGFSQVMNYTSSSIFHPVMNYWPGSYYRLDEDSLNSHTLAARISSQVRGEIDDTEQQVERGSAADDLQCPKELELPDLNLDPPL